MSQPPPPSRGRVAVLGDVGGHLAELREELLRLGADPESGEIPDGLLIVQVGDLIHRGPDSDGVVMLVDRFLRRSPDRWVQLVGNHEAQYLRLPKFDWPETISPPAQERLRDWWVTGRMVVAASFRTDRGPFLVTHAGLTAGFWRVVLDTAPTAEQACTALNAMIGQRGDQLFRSGSMLGGGRPNRLAGPIWAEAGRELVASWLETRLPFSQVHGHSSIIHWDGDGFRGSARVRELTEANYETRHETTRLDGGVIVGVDPGHDADSRLQWRAWQAELI